MTDDPTLFNNPNRPILNTRDVNGLGQALLALTQQVWVLSDRMQILELILAEQGINTTELIDNYQPSPEVEAQLRERGSNLVASVLEALAKSKGE